MTDEPIITLKVKLDNIFQMISNKVTSWSQTPSNDNYPSEKLVKDSLDEKISKSNTSGLIKNDGTVDTTSYSTFDGNYNNLTNKPSIPVNTSDLNNDNGFITDSQVINNDNLCIFQTLIPLINENEQISNFSFEDYDFNIIFTINPNMEENNCQGSIEIGDPAFNGVLMQYSNQGITIQTSSGDEWNIILNMDSENIVKIKQDQSTNDLTFTVNDYEVVSTDNSEIPKNILEITSSVGTISFGVKICTQIITKKNFKQELYIDLFDVMDCININFNNLDNIYLLDTILNIDNYNGFSSKNCSISNNVLTNTSVSAISLNKEFTPSTNYTLEFDYYTSVSNRNGFYFGADPLLENGVNINNSNDGLQVIVDIGNTYIETFNGSSSPTNVYTHTSNLLTEGTHHIKIVRNGTNATFYIDDIELYTYTNAKYNTIGLNKWGYGYNSISNIEMTIGD